MGDENSILEKKENLKPFQSAFINPQDKVIGLWDAMKRAVGSKQYTAEEKEAWWKKQKGKLKIGLIRTKELDTRVTIFNEVFDFSKITKKKKQEEQEKSQEDQEEQENSMKIQGQVRVKGFDTDKNITETPEKIEQPETFYTAKEFDRFYLGWLEDSSYTEQERTVIKSTMKQLFRFIFGTKKLKDVNDFHTHLIIAYTSFTPSEKIPCSNVLREHLKKSLEFYNDMVVRYIMEASNVYGVKGNTIKSPWKVPFDLQDRIELQKGLKDMIDLLDDEYAKCIEYGEDSSMTVQDQEILEKISSLTKTDLDYERLLRIFKKFVEDRQTESPQSTYNSLKKEFMIGKPEQTQKGKELFDSLVELLKVGPEEAEDMRVTIEILSFLMQKVKTLFEIQSKLDDILCRLKKGEIKPGDEEERERLEAENKKILEEIKKRAGFSRAIQAGDLKGFLDELERRLPEESGSEEIARLRQQLEDLQREKNLQEERLGITQSALDQAQRKLQLTPENTGDLRRQLEEAQRELARVAGTSGASDAEARVREIRVQLERTEAARAKAEADKKLLDAEIAALRARLSAGGISQEEAQSLRDEVGALTTAIDAERAHRQALQEGFERQGRELQTAQAETLEIEVRLAAARTELDRLRAQGAAQGVGGSAELQRRIEGQDKYIADLRGQLSTKAEAEARAAAAVAAQTAAEQTIETLRREIAALRAGPAAVENSSRIAELEGQKRSLEAQLQTLLIKGVADEASIAQLRAEIAAASSSQEPKNIQITDLTAQIGKLSGEIANLKQTLSQTEGEKGELQRQLAQKQEQLRELQIQSSLDLETLSEEVKAAFAKVQAEAAELRADSAAKGEEITAKQQEITAKQQEIDALISGQAQRDATIAELNAKIEAKDAEIAQLEAGAASDEEIKTQMSEHIEQYKRILAELRRQVAELTAKLEELRAKEAENASLIQMLDAALRDKTARLAVTEERIRELTGQVADRVEGRYLPGALAGGAPREYREGVIGRGSGLTLRSPVAGKIGYGAPGVGGWVGRGGAIKETPKLPKSSYCETMITLLLLHAYQNGLTDIQTFLDKAGASLDDLGQCPLVIHTLSKLIDSAEEAKGGEKEGVYFTPMNSEEQEQLKVIERVFNDRFDEEEQNILESFYPLTLYSKTPDQFQTVLGRNPYILNIKGQTQDKGYIPIYGIGDDIVLEESEQEALTEGGVPLGALLFLYLTCLRELEQTGESPSLNSKCHLPSPRRTKETVKTPKRKQKRKGKTLTTNKA